MTVPCLPRCFDPVFPDECYSRAEICCIEWIAGDGNVVTWDASANMTFPANVPDEQEYSVPDWKCYCQRSHKGAVGVYGWDFEEPPNHVVYARYDNATLLDLGAIECYSCVCASTVKSTGTEVFVHHFAKDLVYWSGDNYSFPDYPGWPGFTFPRGETWEYLVANAATNGLFVAPALRWICEGIGPAAKVRFVACWHIGYLVTEGPFTGEGWSILAPYAMAEVELDWWYGDPAPSITLTRMGDDWPDSVVQPRLCDYSPCGPSLDCFADCISGTKDCDGMTPAHKPVIYFTLDILGCCLNGTHALTYNSAGSHGPGYYGTVTCDAGIAGVHTLEISVTCCSAASLGSISDTGSLVCLILKMTTTFPSGPPLVWQIVTLVPMGCSDGALDEASGSFTGSDCGLTGNGGWVIHG